MDVINTWWSLEDLDLRCSGMLSSLTLELGRNMSSNLGMNSLPRVISPMAMRSHSTTDVTTKFGNLSSDIKKIGMTMIVTKLTLCCLFCLLRLLWSTPYIPSFVFLVYLNNITIINVTYILIFTRSFILILNYKTNNHSCKINYKWPVHMQSYRLVLSIYVYLIF